MFRLPVCPYCGKKIEYKSSAAVIFRKGNVKCRRCGKLSKPSYVRSCVIMAVVAAALMIALNTLMFFKGNNYTLLPNFIVTMCAVAVYFILIPLKVRLSEIEGQREPEPKRKKNRHRHKKVKYENVKFNEDPLKGTSFDE